MRPDAGCVVFALGWLIGGLYLAEAGRLLWATCFVLLAAGLVLSGWQLADDRETWR